MPRTVAFNKAQKPANTAYDRELRRMVARVSDPNANIGDTHVIFLDKNHPNDDGITKAAKEITIDDKSITLKKLYLIPEVDSDNLFLPHDLPFSVNFLAQVYAWGQNRSDH